VRVLYFKGDTHCVTNRAGHTQRAGNGKRKETVGWSARESEHGTHFFSFSCCCFFFISPLTLSLSVVMQLALRPRVTLASSHSTGASPARRVVALPSRCVE